MKIYTKKGDKGTTALFGGKRLPKNHLKIEAYGTVDELNAYIGLVRDLIEDDEQKKLLIEIQDRLFTIGAHLATDIEKKDKLTLPNLYQKDIELLEKAMDIMNETIPPMRAFVLPGGHPTVSHCHIARCVCRRAERKIVALNMEENVDELILSYLNRLSDYLFVLARKLTIDLNAEEIEWHPKKD
ncbi:MAG TPA: cob(I)yrinic acid a,c-diamide adenosyltransferase [Flavobacteriales bacterium]|nr:cob(I)yrinic acid a,c-diamide adenosyltransferase [Flavobacteriales bacterium]